MIMMMLIIMLFIKGHATVNVETRAVMDPTLNTVSAVSTSVWAT